MIVILCESFNAAKDAFEMFVYYLTYREPWEIRAVRNYANQVVTWDDLCYTFMDGKYIQFLSKHIDQADILSEGEFFEGLPWFYDDILEM